LAVAKTSVKAEILCRSWLYNHLYCGFRNQMVMWSDRIIWAVT